MSHQSLTRAAAVFAVATVGIASATFARASAPPVGPLPKGPVVDVKAVAGSPIAVALPRAASAGYVWRVAKTPDPRIATEIGEGEIAGHVVVLFQMHRAGETTIAFGLTRGERPRAVRAVTYDVSVAPATS